MSLCALAAVGVLAPVLLPMDVERRPQHTRLDERAHVQPHTVVQVGLPADRLLVQLLPPHEDVERLLALEDQLELALQLQRRRQPRLGAGHLVAHPSTLPLDPVLAQIGVGQLLQHLAVETVVVHQRREAVAKPVPHMPHERPVAEQRAVLLEELVAQPVRDVLLLAPRLIEQLLHAAPATTTPRTPRRAPAAPDPPPAPHPPPTASTRSHRHQRTHRDHPTPPAPATGSRPAEPPPPATAPSTPPAAPRTTTASDHPTTAQAADPPPRRPGASGRCQTAP